MKIIVGSLIGIGVVFLIVVTVVLGPYTLRVQHFQANPSEGYYADFYVYVSPDAKIAARNGKVVTFLVQPNNSGINSDDPGVHRRDAWFTGFERHRIANELGVVLLVPAFVRPGEDWYIYTHALDRDSLTTERADLKRIDLQLIAMIEHARTELAKGGIQTNEKILIQGFSASGMFANRFTILHPDQVKGAAIGSPGGWPVAPIPEYNGQVLPYPAGTADLEELTGIPFDMTTFKTIPQLIYMGDLDDNDSLDFTDGWEAETAGIVDQLFGTTPLARWDDAKDIYNDSGANVKFLLIEGAGHNRRALQAYTVEFFKNILDQ